MRPCMSERRPKIGNEAVEVREYAVNAHAYKENPCNSAMIRGKDVPTTVKLSDTRKRTTRTPAKAACLRRGESCAGSVAAVFRVTVMAAARC